MRKSSITRRKTSTSFAAYVKEEIEIDPSRQLHSQSSFTPEYPTPSSSPSKSTDESYESSSEFKCNIPPPSHTQRRVTLSNVISEGHVQISAHALDRLGVDKETLKKEKGMKKLGICDTDLVREEELKRYCGVVQRNKHSGTLNGPIPKTEFILGFTEEQIQREKAVKQLGTTEQEILDDYCHRVSSLGTQTQSTSVN
jgi:hypothetical protein